MFATAVPRLLVQQSIQPINKKHSSFAALVLCDGNPSVTDGFPHKGPFVWQAFLCYDVTLYQVCDKCQLGLITSGFGALFQHFAFKCVRDHMWYGEGWHCACAEDNHHIRCTIWCVYWCVVNKKSKLVHHALSFRLAIDRHMRCDMNVFKH